MRAIAQPRRSAQSPRLELRGVALPLRSHRIELLWAVFAVACFAAMLAWPSWEQIPFFLAWISLTLVYDFRVWPTRPTLVVLLVVMVATGVAIAVDASNGVQRWAEVFEVPLMAALFLASVWHARRRVDALQIAEQRSEQRRSLLERQERFIYDASHELRTPVTIARGHLELVPAHGSQAAEIEVALDELARIDAIIERLLVLATADQTNFLHPAEIDVEPFLEDVFMRWSEVAPRAWRLGPLVPGRLRVDPERLRTALDALLENAVKYTWEHAAIELRARYNGAWQLSIEVEDEGCGVPDEALGRIFDRFARADAARTRTAGGVGLGLAIVDAIAKGHGGHCTVRSTAHGSTFALKLPCFAPEEALPPRSWLPVGEAPARSDTRAPF
jgi:signal transduction histidine kinase